MDFCLEFEVQRHHCDVVLCNLQTLPQEILENLAWRKQLVQSIHVSVNVVEPQYVLINYEARSIQSEQAFLYSQLILSLLKHT